MKPQHSHCAILFPQLAAAASLHAIFLLFSSPRALTSDHTGMVIWWGCLCLTYSVLALLLRRPRSVRTVALVATGGFLVQLVLTFMTALLPSSIFSWFILLAMWGCLYVRCCIQLLEGTQTESVITTFELSVLALFVIGFGVSVSAMHPVTLLHCAIGDLLALVALVRIRSGHTRVDNRTARSPMSRLFLVALLAGIGGLAAALAALATDSASHLLSRLTQWCFSLLRAVALQADRLLRWLLSLLPKQHMNSVLLEEAEAQAPGGAANWGTLDSQLLFYLMLGALVCLALFLLVWVLRKGGLHGAAFRSRTAAPIQRRRPGFKELLRQLRHRFCRWAAFRMSYWKLRNTAPGLFVWLEQQMRGRHLERSPGETARAFLTRIQTALPDCEDSLSRLADCLDQHYFGDGQSLSAAEITAMRKQIRTKLQQQTSEKTADT